ncbi:hypothetical protein [Streptomyces sp. NPDC049585]|uniref:hypothetical protein n=1 Tax=Streptomyces sp. NPDC049585 TaxID=3155154 RepID=UPI00342CBAEB
MSDSTSDSYDAPSGPAPSRRSARPVSLRTLGRAARWETLALLVVLLVLAFAFA